MLTKVREYFYVLVLMLNLTFGKYSGLVDSASYVRSLLAASPPESNLSPKSHVLNLLPLLPFHTRFCVLKLGIQDV
jgi:hypothetical protein